MIFSIIRLTYSTISMAKSEVKLIGKWSSPYVIRVKIALNIKSIEYENLEENETFNPKSDLLIQSNPVYGKVPVLIHKDKPICESLIIVEYIDETWSTDSSILPSDSYDRSLARFWVAYLDQKVASFLLFPFYFMFRSSKLRCSILNWFDLI